MDFEEDTTVIASSPELGPAPELELELEPGPEGSAAVVELVAEHAAEGAFVVDSAVGSAAGSALLVYAAVARVAFAPRIDALSLRYRDVAYLGPPVSSVFAHPRFERHILPQSVVATAREFQDVLAATSYGIHS